MNGKLKQLRFGTSGLRDTVENMTDMECYINTLGFIAFLAGKGEFRAGGAVALGGDRRPSTPRIKRAVAAAVRDSGGEVDDQGLAASPALALYAVKRGIPSIMVTGSHIPADRNGIKFTKRSGEVLKSEEQEILADVAAERERIYAMTPEELPFDEKGMFKPEAAGKAGSLLRGGDYEGPAVGEYIERYGHVFGPAPFPHGTEIFLYQHSAVARDAVKKIFEALGAEVIAPDDDVRIEYADELGERKEETVSPRSQVFVPVDTESVSNKTMAVFKKVMDENGLDIGISTDGDSDRPLLVYRVYRDGKATGEVSCVTGDILGLLTVLALEEMGVAISAAAVPVSANDAIAKVLAKKGVEITQTRIGSPYVVAAMNASIEEHPGSRCPGWNVFGWEANGGFLTGSDITVNGRVLKALPTRDAVLPLLAVIMMARKAGVPVSSLLGRLPARYTHANRKKEVPAETGKAIIQSISSIREGNVRQVDFAASGEAVVTYSTGEVEKVGAGSELHEIKDRLEALFTADDGFSGISGLNYIDGVRIFFTNGEISHLRPSGNAPEFRNYAIASSPERAREIVEIGLKKILPAMAKAAGRPHPVIRG
ncbi:MAG: hypothetical protein P9M00_01305 [Candidatus Tritonobacter lacicola]|nr:hypothetical protein [Candidatus Tritonobacter lacicola]